MCPKQQTSLSAGVAKVWQPMTRQLWAWDHETLASDRQPGWPACGRPPAFLQCDGVTVFLPRTSPGGLPLPTEHCAFRLAVPLSPSPEGTPTLGVRWALKSKWGTNETLHKITLKKCLPHPAQLFLKQCFWLESAPQDQKMRLSHTK